jgi:hypothetical protein
LRFGGEDANPLAARLEVGRAAPRKDGSTSCPCGWWCRRAVSRSSRAAIAAKASLRIPSSPCRTVKVLTTPVRGMPLPVDLAALPRAANGGPGAGAARGAPQAARGQETSSPFACTDEVGKETSVVRREVVVGRAAR